MNTFAKVWVRFEKDHSLLAADIKTRALRVLVLERETVEDTNRVLKSVELAIDFFTADLLFAYEAASHEH